MNVISKSRFKIGLSCPNKLFYSKNKAYKNKSSDDSFLASLAEGGFQVEGLARLHYPNGTFVESEKGDYKKAFQQTTNLLSEKDAIVYEASFLHENLFVMSDIIVKKGNTIKLIEVKAKSYDSGDEHEFIGKNGKILSGWKPYLFDIAFQKYVIQLCYPNHKIESYFMLADKTKQSTIDGLNQMIRLPTNGNERKAIELLLSPEEAVKTSVLSEVNVSQIVEDILIDKQTYSSSLSFNSALSLFQNIYLNEEFPGWPTHYSSCKNCEFKLNHERKSKGNLCGFTNCMEQLHRIPRDKMDSPTIFEIWNFRGQKHLEEGTIFQSQLSKKDFDTISKGNHLTSNQRRWLQIEKSINGSNQPFVKTNGLVKEMDLWEFPLHFIDFETSAVALPFTKGMRPYEQIAFQFSHHMVKSDGSISHESQFISNIPGEFPNFKFLDALKKSLENDNGTIFRFASHENSILNAIKTQLEESEIGNKKELIDFIRSIAKPTGNSEDNWTPTRKFVDLREVIMDYYYHPLTRGSNSIKAVLPAILSTCDFLKSKYSQSIGSINVSSLNFDESQIWIKTKDKKTTNPYNNLPSLFLDWTTDKRNKLISGLENIADGGAALTAYGKLQFTDMQNSEREEITNSLLKYCELDTLAMVMIYEHLKYKVD